MVVSLAVRVVFRHMMRLIAPMLRWLLVLLWMAFIYYWSSRSTTPSPDWITSKLAHVVEYSLLSWLLAYALGFLGRWAILAWLLATAYGSTDEVHQLFTPLRHPQVQDIVLDSAAAALALQVLRYVHSRRSVRS